MPSFICSPRCTGCTFWAAWWRGGGAVAKLWRGAEVVDLRLGVELCAVYWHYLLLVWLILFTLLLFS